MIRFLKTNFPDNKKELQVFTDASYLKNYQKISAVRYLNSPLENAKLCEEQYREGKTALETLPSIITLTMTVFCNYKTPCLKCDRNVRSESAYSEISDDVMNAAMPLLKTAKLVYLHCGGEPMFSKQFDETIKIVDFPTQIVFSTNAMLLNKRRADLFLEKGNVPQITVSFDAATENMYRIMRPSGKFKTVVDNISYLTKRKSTLNLDKPRIILHMTVCRKNLSDVPKLVDLAQEIGADVVSYDHLNSGLDFNLNTVDSQIWDYKKQADFENPSYHNEMILEAYQKAKSMDIRIRFVGEPFLGPMASEIDHSITEDLASIFRFADEIPISPFHRDANNGRPHCLTPWREVVIQPTGDVRSCYFHDMERYKIGNILDTDFMEIWNSSDMVKMREQAFKKSFARMCYASEPCYYRGRE